jgi:hypothetical protein
MRPALRIGKQKSAIESNAKWRRSRLVSVGAVSAARNQLNYPGIAIAIPRTEMRNFGAKRSMLARIGERRDGRTNCSFSCPSHHNRRSGRRLARQKFFGAIYLVEMTGDVGNR